jgi:hypothetical protein
VIPLILRRTSAGAKYDGVGGMIVKVQVLYAFNLDKVVPADHLDAQLARRTCSLDIHVEFPL